jgi:hypothetical protein
MAGQDGTVAIPPGIAALGADVEDRIAALVRDARVEQGRELARALDDALRIVPRPLRGIVRKIAGV